VYASIDVRLRVVNRLIGVTKILKSNVRWEFVRVDARSLRNVLCDVRVECCALLVAYDKWHEPYRRVPERRLQPTFLNFLCQSRIQAIAETAHEQHPMTKHRRLTGTLSETSTDNAEGCARPARMRSRTALGMPSGPALIEEPLDIRSVAYVLSICPYAASIRSRIRSARFVFSNSWA
jgi:hypothetical protein